MSNATIRVSFGESSYSDVEGHISADIPSELNDNKTGFVPGDTVVIAVYMSANVTIKSVDASAGAITVGAAVELTKTEEIMFEDTNAGSLQVPVDSITNVEWIGRSLGSVTLQSNKMAIKTSSKGVAIAKITYTCTARLVSLVSPAEINGSTEYSILALIVGEKV